eukprot:TRINITY_DN4240_c0_g3_i1.p1 TRINITY_DN4240_c0_g3~~TRINITY_DN4240_c0_g3_i1.p1  ORF type:complete len:963 (-),score=237.71 TRINITY_DN4240_c0_g3_i1:64-2829(-)
MSAPASSSSEDPKRKESDNLKTQANTCFEQKKYVEAVQLYDKAIDLFETAVLYSNRAFAHLRMENFGSAIVDANKSIALDPNYVKGYYRLGAAYQALGKHKDALRIFRQVVKIVPNDKDARTKLSQCEKEVKRAAFEEAIASEHTVSVFQDLDVNSYDVPASYTGLHMPNPITPEFAVQFLEELKAQKVIHIKYAVSILQQAHAVFSKAPTLVEYNIPQDGKFTVCGDVHGQFYDLCNIFQLNGLPSEENPYLFNGDFVDRGSFSVEVIMTLLVFKILYPRHFFLARGNHESKNMNMMYGFEGEVKAKYNEKVYHMFSEIFCLLPLAHLISGKILVVHGGLFSSDDVTLDDIKNINRNREPPDSGLMSELLWSDPQPQPGRSPSKRGVGLSFGPDVTARFLEKNKLDLIIRSHEVKEEGYLVEHGGKLITLFSAPNYCLAAGTKITLSNQLTVPIEEISSNNSTKLLSYSKDSNNCVLRTTQSPHRFNQGVKPCVELVLEDSRKIVCTPDHTVLTTRGEVQVQNLNLKEDRILVAPQGVQFMSELCDWSLDLKNLNVNLNMSTNEGQLRLLAFARILGFTVFRPNNNEITLHFENELDRDSFVDDIKLVLENSEVQTSSQETFCVELPSVLLQECRDVISNNAALFGINTPVSFVREFLASVFGGYALISTSLVPIKISVKSRDVDADLLIKQFTQFSSLMKRFGLEGAAYSEKSNEFTIQVTFELPSNQIVKFAECIGIRNSLSKQKSIEVISGYYKGVTQREQQFRTLTNIIQEILNKEKITLHEAVHKGIETLKQTEVILSGVSEEENLSKVYNQTNNNTNLYKDFNTYLRDIGENSTKKTDSVCWSLGVMGMRNVGSLPTFDLSVHSSHLFVANGLVVHNCDQVGNKGAFIVFRSDLKPNITSFKEVKHPDVKAMAY